MASSEQAFVPPRVDRDEVEKNQNEGPQLRVIEGGLNANTEVSRTPDSAIVEGGINKINSDPPVVQEHIDLKQLFREDAQATDQRVDEIRKNIEIPAPSIELTDEDIEDISGVEYLNAQPGEEEVKGSTYESTTDKVKTLRMKNNPLEGKQALEYDHPDEDAPQTIRYKNLSEKPLPRFPEEVEMAGGKGELPRFETSEEHFSKQEELTAADIIEDDMDKAA